MEEQRIDTGGGRARTQRGGFWLCGLAAGLIGCASEAGPTPSERCIDYQSAFCDKANECAEPSERADLRESCEFVWQVYSVCERVRAVMPSYFACMEAIHAIPCAAVPSGSFPDFPSECTGIFAVDP